MFEKFPSIEQYRHIVKELTEHIQFVGKDGAIYAQSRNRIVNPSNDNLGFADWVTERLDCFKEITTKLYDAYGWFSTTKQLPKPNQLVIIAVDLGLDTPKICLGSYIKDDTPITDDGNTYSCSHWWNDENDDFMWEFKEVKYWQWLPELPQVKE